LRNLPHHLRDPLAAAVVVASISQLASVRPQGFTLTLYAVTLLGIARGARWLPGLFALWANLHGGWLFGLACVGTKAVVDFRRRHVVIFLACCLATLLTPYGIHLWVALFDAVRRGWADVSEWQQIFRVDVALSPILIWSSLSAFLLWAALKRLSVGRFAWLWTAIAAVAGFRSQRLVPLYAITVVMLIAPGISARTPAQAATKWTREAIAVILAAASAAVLFIYMTLAPVMRCLPPVKGRAIAPEASAVAFIRQADLYGRVVMWFDWGLYALWHVGDQLVVSIDNRRETVYSDEVVQRHLLFYAGDDPGYVDEIKADYVWLPVNLPPVRQLQARGWHTLFRGPRSMILGRKFAPVSTGDLVEGTPCFPNP
jgi:hypothetical protein